MKPRVNNTVAAHRLFTAGNYAAYRRHTRRRASLQDGKVIVTFIKLLPEGMAICQDCKRSYYQADGEGCQCHVCWAASLTPPTPPWQEGQCVECGLPCEPGFFLHNDCLKPIHARYFQEGA